MLVTSALNEKIPGALKITRGVWGVGADLDWKVYLGKWHFIGELKDEREFVSLPLSDSKLTRKKSHGYLWWAMKKDAVGQASGSLRRGKKHGASNPALPLPCKLRSELLTPSVHT